MSKQIVTLSLVLSLLIFAGCTKQEPVQDLENIDVLEVVEEDSMDTEADTQVEVESEDTVQPEDSSEDQDLAQLEQSAAVYTAYSPDALETYEGQNKVIFFHATWCPGCRRLDSDLTSRLSELPANTVVLKADYDSESELKQKYGVRSQHTLVFVDDQGNETQKLVNESFDNLLQKL